MAAPACLGGNADGGAASVLLREIVARLASVLCYLRSRTDKRCAACFWKGVKKVVLRV